MRPLLSLPLVCLALPGCIHLGPADGMLYVVGSTPSNSTCTLSVHASGRKGVPAQQLVSGNFREAFMVGPSWKGHVATLQCDGAVLAERRFKYGKDVRFGGELSIDSPYSP